MLMSKIGNKNFTLLGKMMSLTSARQRVIAQNVANVNTPNYRRRELRFESALAQAMSNGRAADYASVQGWVDRPNNTVVRNNGNNVDIDLEMMNMNENAVSYQIYTELYGRKSNMVKSAIRGVR